MPMWEQVVLGMVMVAVLFFFWPGIKASMNKSQQAENPDWKGVFIPIGAVILFVIILIAFAKA